ncbi:hypothetical protein DTO021D3_5071 [Paecilomyces variotii]|nr:hypothetical protein DTO032I3_6821 [Paecilomyces variotii]KAJ9278104.1 hypothetical protein DTO021D3_5071 [Paecilomyces variotii]KAJ9345807.1 hypothetical protein DTO027B6_1767 [Paecilomyces variotii]KAJ9387345.1 hypothetical protein DTO032I4_3209 [Paecilomyces variotii]
MWLYRGVQSAVFYYASCTPCAGAIDRRKRKKDAVRSRRQKAKDAALVTDQPRPFAQPTPFSTNEGWKEEIALGPGPPARRGGNRAGNNRSHSRQTERESNDAAADSSTSLGYESPHRRGGIGERWNWMHHQREDEPLWGQEAKGSSVGISGRGRSDTNASGKYYAPRAPPVNDLHPPIVSGPTSRAETRWMLQPLPSAKVMAGKAGSDASTRGSRGGSQKKRVNVRPPGALADSDDEDDIQDEHSTPADGRPGWLRSRSANSKRTSPDKSYRLPPLTTSENQSSIKDYAAENVKLTTRSPLAASATHTGVPTQSRKSAESQRLNTASSSIYSVSSSPSLLSSHADSADASSPYLQYGPPETPRSRPGSKETGLSDKAFSNPMSITRQDFKDIQTVHLEINGEGNILQEPDQVQQMRPFRWSMDL